MPSASQPDPSGEGEVVEVFTGDTLEEAMAAAVAGLGPDLTVRRARKVRAGVRGLLGRDRYEVLAVPAAGRRRPLPRSADAVGSALDALLEAADEQEAGGPAARPGVAALGRPPAVGPAQQPAPARAAARPADRRARTAAARPPLRRVRPPPRPPDRARAARPRCRPASPCHPPAAAAPEPEPPARGRRGRTLGLPLSGRTPHPDPEVGDHDQAAPSRRRRRTDAAPRPPAAPAALSHPTPAVPAPRPPRPLRTRSPTPGGART